MSPRVSGIGKRTAGWLSIAAALVALGASAPSALSQNGDPPSPAPTSPDELRPRGDRGGKCVFISYDGGETETCTLQVVSFDGAPLDVDITRPARQGGRQRHRLIAMLHGFGADKRSFESTTDEADEREEYHWNSHWFAKHGYYVITHTARGFTTERKQAPYQPDTPSGSSCSYGAPLPPASNGPPCDPADLTNNGRIRLKSRDFEARDTKFLMQLAATAYDSIDEQEAAVTGLSYGAGESWVLASQPEFDIEGELPTGTLGTPPPGKERVLDAVRIQVALPRYGWTDLAYSLAPNGHPGDAADAKEADEGKAECTLVNTPAQGKPGPQEDLYASSQGMPNDRHGDGYPLGVPKLSYIGGFFTLGATRGAYQQYENGPSQNTCVFSTEGPIDIPVWNASVLSNDPYDIGGFETKEAREIREGLTEYRSGYYQDEGWKAQNTDGERTAVHVIQGWTDDLFPATEAFRQFKYLKRLDSRWPVEAELADIGHPRGINKPSTWRRLNQRAFGFLQQQIPGAHDQETVVSSEPTLCDDDGEPDGGRTDENVPSQHLTGRTPEQLSQGKLSIEYPPGVLPPGSGSGDPDGLNSDPVFRNQTKQDDNCVNSVAPTHPTRYTAESAPLKDSSTYIGLGKVELPATHYTGDGAATVNVRVWDVPPGKDPEECERSLEDIEAIVAPTREDPPRPPNPPEEEEGCPLLMTRGTYRLSAFYEPEKFPPAPGVESLEGCLDAELEGVPDLEELSGEEGEELACPQDREEALDRVSEVSGCVESEADDTLDDVGEDLPSEVTDRAGDLSGALDDLTADQLDAVEEDVEDELERLSSAAGDCADEAVADAVEGLSENTADCIEAEADETVDEVESRLEGLSTEDLEQELDDLPEELEEDLTDASESCLEEDGDEPADGDGDSEGPTLTIPLFGNHWRLEPGHRIRLDVMQVDEPFLLRSKVPDAFAFSDARLTLPTRESGERELTVEEEQDEQDEQRDPDAPESSPETEIPEAGPAPTLPGPGAPTLP